MSLIRKTTNDGGVYFVDSKTGERVKTKMDIEPGNYFNDLSDEELNLKVLLTTESILQDLKIEKRIEVISAECAFGMNLIEDFFTSMSDVFGGRSKTTQNTLREARKKVLRELKVEALKVGANAVIGVDLDYSEFSGKLKSMLFLVASGTAVVIKQQSDQ